MMSKILYRIILSKVNMKIVTLQIHKQRGIEEVEVAEKVKLAVMVTEKMVQVVETLNKIDIIKTILSNKLITVNSKTLRQIKQEKKKDQQTKQTKTRNNKTAKTNIE